MMTADSTATEGFRNPENRQRILDAGAAEFARAGYSGARISAIAQVSGLNKQLIYHYFGSKQGLYEAVMRQMLQLTFPAASFGLAGVLGTVELVSGQDAARIALFQRLLGWEGLEYAGGPIAFADDRRAAFDSIDRAVEQAQQIGSIDARLDPQSVTLLIHMAFVGPTVLAQLTAGITGAEAAPAETGKRMQATLAVLLGVDPEALGGTNPIECTQTTVLNRIKK